MKKQNVRTLSLIVSTLTYLLIGAAIFDTIESEEEKNQFIALQYLESQMFEKYNITQEDFLMMEEIVLLYKPYKAGKPWKFAGSFYYATTVLTTIGYGHSTPKTVGGKIFTMVYATLGIPLGLVMFNAIGERLNKFSSGMINSVRKSLKSKQTETTEIDLILVAFVLYTIIMGTGATAFSHYEGWSYFEAMYYCFTTLTTIGFGDLVALQQDNALEEKPEYVTFALFFIIFGLAVISAVLNLVVLKFVTMNTEDEKRDEIEAIQAAKLTVRLDGDIIMGGLTDNRYSTEGMGSIEDIRSVCSCTCTTCHPFFSTTKFLNANQEREGSPAPPFSPALTDPITDGLDFRRASLAAFIANQSTWASRGINGSRRSKRQLYDNSYFYYAPGHHWSVANEFAAITGGVGGFRSRTASSYSDYSPSLPRSRPNSVHDIRLSELTAELDQTEEEELWRAAHATLRLSEEVQVSTFDVDKYLAAPIVNGKNANGSRRPTSPNGLSSYGTNGGHPSDSVFTPRRPRRRCPTGSMDDGLYQASLNNNNSNTRSLGRPLTGPASTGVSAAQSSTYCSPVASGLQFTNSTLGRKIGRKQQEWLSQQQQTYRRRKSSGDPLNKKATAERPGGAKYCDNARAVSTASSSASIRGFQQEQQRSSGAMSPPNEDSMCILDDDSILAITYDSLGSGARPKKNKAKYLTRNKKRRAAQDAAIAMVSGNESAQMMEEVTASRKVDRGRVTSGKGRQSSLIYSSAHRNGVHDDVDDVLADDNMIIMATVHTNPASSYHMTSDSSLCRMSSSSESMARRDCMFSTTTFDEDVDKATALPHLCSTYHTLPAKLRQQQQQDERDARQDYTRLQQRHQHHLVAERMANHEMGASSPNMSHYYRKSPSAPQDQRILSTSSWLLLDRRSQEAVGHRLEDSASSMTGLCEDANSTTSASYLRPTSMRFGVEGLASASRRLPYAARWRRGDGESEEALCSLSSPEYCSAGNLAYEATPDRDIDVNRRFQSQSTSGQQQQFSNIRPQHDDVNLRNPRRKSPR